jgi:DNA-binding transcriptional ArsR family regulator
MSEGEAGRLERLERQLREFGDRLAALEPVPADAPRSPAAPSWAGMPPTADVDDESDFSFTGRARFGGQMLYIQQRGGLAEVMNANPERVARVFAALSSPARIVLVRALLDGPRTSQELRQELDDPSVGQLYHHLRELLAAGLVVQPGRSVYALPRGSQIALCMQILTAASMLPTGLATQPPELEEGDPAQDDADG